MTGYEPFVAVVMTCVVAVAFAWVPSGVTAHHSWRIEQLNDATLLLRSHTEALERFFFDPNAPGHLKDFLLRWSDAMDDRQQVLLAGVSMAKSEWAMPAEHAAEAAALRADLTALEQNHPALVRTFEVAVRTMALGSLLRWPESAERFHSAVTSFAAEPERELDIAVSVARYREIASVS